MTALAIGGGDTFALAKLMLDVDDTRAAADDEDLRAARETQREEDDRQVQALHDAADDVRNGAWVEGGLGLAGGALSIVGTAAGPTHVDGADAATKAALAARQQQSNVVTQVGQTLSKLAQPTSTLVGSAPAKDAEARATQHKALSDDAGARAEEAEHQRDRVLDGEDRTLATLQSTLQAEADGRLAIIANV